MGVFYETIPESQFEWIRKQKVFWVATAPLSGAGHVNVSPKGGPYFDVLDKKTFYYMELTGSGSETISHLHEPGNGRITIQFNAFEGAPKIFRLWGKGRVLENGTGAFESFVEAHGIETIPGTRSIIIVDVHQAGGSCGFSVPFYEFKEYRPVLNDHFRKKQERFLAGNESESMDRYWAYKSAYSIDGLPAMKRGLDFGRKEQVEPMKKMVGVDAVAPRFVRRYREGYYTPEQAMLLGLLCLLFGFAAALYGPRLLRSCFEVLPEDAKSLLAQHSRREWHF